MSYDVHSNAIPANEEKIFATLQPLWQKQAIVLVALIESAAMIAATILQVSPKDWSKTVNQIKFKEREPPLDPLNPPLITSAITLNYQSKKC